MNDSFIQVPSFSQGLESQGSISVSQFVPVNPSGHKHMKIHPSDIQVPPFIQSVEQANSSKDMVKINTIEIFKFTAVYHLTFNNYVFV